MERELPPNLRTIPRSRAANIEVLTGGGNNRVMRVTRDDGALFAVKFYYQNPDDQRDRIGVEYSAHEFLWKNGERAIAEPMELNRAANCAVYEYLEGESVSPDKICASDIDQAVEFAFRLRTYTSEKGVSTLAAASEASFSLSSFSSSLEDRIARLLAVTRSDTALFDEFSAFLNDTLIPMRDDCMSRASDIVNSRETGGFQSSLKQSERTLSPSDFGFHNGIRDTEGMWRFFDFEYFGWDDPAKLISDFLLHPAMNLKESLKIHAKSAFLSSWNEPSLDNRLQAVFPLYGVKWCIILLNEFIPAFRARRNFAIGMRPEDVEGAQRKQLEKAQNLASFLVNASR